MAYWQFHYPKRVSFYPPDYDNPGLGGSETALVLLTRQLHRRGHQVEVFNCCYRPGTYDGVRWRMAWELETAPTPDVAVSVRFGEALWPVHSQAEVQLFWMLDSHTAGAASFSERFGERARVIVASLAMQRRLDAAGVKVHSSLISLPVEPRCYSPAEEPVRACLFASMPDRGLDVALRIWPRIYAEVPDVELWVTSGWQLWGFTKSEAADRLREVIGRDTLPEGVKLLGPVSRRDLCSLQQRAWLALYPCRYREMFCLTAAECAAAGVPLIASSIEALEERVVHGSSGILVRGNIEDKATQDQFVTETVSLLRSRPKRDRFSVAARATAKAFDVNAVAACWEDIITSPVRG